MQTHSTAKLVFIGGGNMAEAMIRGILKTGIYHSGDIIVTDVQARRLELFRREHGIAGSSDNKLAASGAGVLVLAVKPQQTPQVLDELKDNLPGNPLVISIITGYSTEKIAAGLGYQARVIRVVPNTPALVGAGASAYCCSAGVSAEDERLADKILTSIGTAVKMDEPRLNAVTALSGSGPAYVFYLAEALLKAGQEIGLDGPAARLLVEATIIGSARLMSETGLPPEELRRRVTSPGGTTEAAVKILDSASIRDAVIAAVKAACKRAMELSS